MMTDDTVNAVSPTAETESVPAPAGLPEDNPSPETDAGGGLDVVFNRQPRRLSAEEAVRYAQQGMKWEQFSPVYRKLQYLAERVNGGIGDIADGLLSCVEQEEWDAISAAHPEDPLTAARLFAEAKAAREAALGDTPAPPPEEERLAAEYDALCAEIPDAPAFSALPEETFAVAKREDISLLDAYLRVLFREQRRTAQALRDQQEAAARSAGSLHGETDDPDTAGEAFIRALNRAL